MLTDIFANRYAKRKIWSSFAESEKRLIGQVFMILEKELEPFYDLDGRERDVAVQFWKEIHGLMAMELGVKSLSPLAYAYNVG